MHQRREVDLVAFVLVERVLLILGGRLVAVVSRGVLRPVRRHEHALNANLNSQLTRLQATHAAKIDLGFDLSIDEEVALQAIDRARDRRRALRPIAEIAHEPEEGRSERLDLKPALDIARIIRRVVQTELE